MSHWNYRLVRDGTYLVLSEVYYDDDSKPNGYLPDGATFAVVEAEEGREGVVAALKMALKDAQEAPIIDVAEIGREIMCDHGWAIKDGHCTACDAEWPDAEA